MSFRHKYEPVVKSFHYALPNASTVMGMISTSDFGRLCGWSTGGAIPTVELPIGTTADWYKFIGYVSGFLPGSATNTTSASTSVQVAIQPVLPGEIIEADYSTTVARAAAANVIATTSIGKYFGIGGGTTTVVLGMYVDPSVASDTPGTTNGLFFKLMGFDTNADICWGSIHSTHTAL